MAELGNCKVCKGRVSSAAHTCPHCGHPNPYDEAQAAIDKENQRKWNERAQLIADRKSRGECVKCGSNSWTEKARFIDGATNVGSSRHLECNGCGNCKYT